MLDTSSFTTLHFKEVAKLTTVQDSAYVTFTIPVHPLLEELLEISLATNNSVKATEVEPDLKPYHREASYLARMAYEVYHELALSLAPWSAEESYDNTVRAKSLKNAPKSHRIRPRPNSNLHGNQIPKGGKTHKKGRRHARDTHTLNRYVLTGMQLLDNDPELRRRFDQAISPHKRILSRGQRQAMLAVAGGAALYAGGSWLLHKLHLDSLLGLSSGDDLNHKMTVALGEVKDRFHADERHLRHLDNAILALTKMEAHIHHASEFELHLGTVDRHFETLRLHTYSLKRGIAELMHHRVTPDLISYSKLRLGFERVIRDAEEKGLLPVVENAADLYRLPAQYIFNKETFEIFVAVAVPLAEKSREMKLYHFLPFPTKVNGSDGDQFIIARPEVSFLGVSDLTKTYIELSAGDLSLCTKLEGIYACPQSGVQLGGASSCLVALYKSDVRSIFKTCDHSLAKRNYVLQKDDHVFQLYLHEPQLITLSCSFNKNEHAKQFRGIVNVNLPYGCTGDIDSFKFTSRKTIMGHTVKLKVSDVPYADEMPDQFKTVLSALERQANHTLTHDEKILGDTKYKIDIAQFHSTAAGMGTLTALGLIACIILGIGIYCCWRRGRRNFKRELERSQGTQLNVNLNTSAPEEQRESVDRDSHPPRYDTCADGGAAALEPRSQKAYYSKLGTRDKC